MDSNKKMTGEPNQQNPTSVFGFDAYPPPFPVNWNQSNPFANAIYQHDTTMIPQQQIPGHTFSTPTDMSPLANRMPECSSSLNDYSLHQQPNGFSFGTPITEQDVVHFPFSNFNRAYEKSEFRCSKRKTDSPPPQPTKQHITEEKMAEHMSKLHISSETAFPKETDTSRMRRLYMCEEMRKLQTDTLLPQSLLSQIQRPCTALVLWKPPTRLLPIEDSDKKSEEATNEAEMVDTPLNNMDLDNC